MNDVVDRASVASPPFRQLAVIGCGLIGSSFALAARRAGFVHHVVGFTLSEVDAADALRRSAVDAIAESASYAVSRADLVLLAVPVGETAGVLRQIQPAMAPSALAMDAGSTKSDVAAAARAELGDAIGRFVPAHPIAGRETAGALHADADLFHGCRAVLTPLPETRSDALRAARTVWEAVGAEVTTMAPAEHDAAVAAVSHLPHLLAAAAVAALAAQPDAEHLLSLAGPGFADFSRIAAGDAHVWRDILLANRGPLQRQVSLFADALRQFEALLRDGDPDALESALDRAARVRRTLSRSAPRPAGTTASE